MNAVMHNQRDEVTGADAVEPGAFTLPLFQREPPAGDLGGLSEAELRASCCGELLRPFWLEDGRRGAVCRKCGQKYTDNTQMQYGGSPWIGVDLDGTLARDLGSGRGDEIGSPIEPMLARVKRWIAEGRTVKIFTARASSPRQVAAVKAWLASVGLPDLEVTNVKDQRMIELWDDRCVQVTTNLGEPIGAKLKLRRHRQPTRLAQPGESAGFFGRLRVLLMTL
ncbi:MAG TPA: hypothetical protein VMB80_15605 [Candidatus Acidoferrum sp.]|nr:hypothetical protein [Candidatus Acidoferrum sp.]